MTWAIERIEECGSTMDEARQRAHAGAPDGTVVIAERMTGGRGTHGRSWHAPEGGLYLSAIFRDIEDPRLVTLAMGNAVADVLEVAGAQPGLKWVNDVWADGKKIAGVLVEAESTGDRMDFLVVGIGVNVNGDPASWPDGLAATATTLQAQVQAEQCIEDLEAYLLEELERWITKVRNGRSKEILDHWRARDVLRGQPVRVEEDGIEGTAHGIDDDGHLLVDTHSGVLTVEAGHVLLTEG